MKPTVVARSEGALWWVGTRPTACCILSQSSVRLQHVVTSSLMRRTLAESAAVDYIEDTSEMGRQASQLRFLSKSSVEFLFFGCLALMYICYVDESGTPEIPGTSSHFVLCGLAVPVENWRASDKAVSDVLERYGLGQHELHTAWMARAYLEQSKITDFELLSYAERRSRIRSFRTAELLRLQKAANTKALRQAKKNYGKTEAYIHLTHSERMQCLREVADLVSSWGNARLYAECIDKVHFDPVKTGKAAEEQGFEQVISRFQKSLARKASTKSKPGLIVHDNNQSVAKKHTELMRGYHDKGTLWTAIPNIVETPLFVDSSLTRMVQIADLCAYALRRYVENGEVELFRKVFTRADRLPNGQVVGIRHYTNNGCACEICKGHRLTS